MSAYEKTRPPHLHNYDPTQPFQNFSYTAPPYSSQSQIPTTTATSFQNAGQMTHMEYASNPARSIYDEQSGPYLNVGSTPVPTVTSFSPSRGTGGTNFCVYISSLYDLTTTTLPSFYLMFGSRKCHASLKKMNQQGAVCQYAVTTDVPAFVATNWTGSPVPVSLLMESGDSELMCRVDVGGFTYILDGGAQSTSSAPMDMSRKRRLSNESVEETRSPAKRVSSSQLRSKEEYGSYGFTPTEIPPYSPYLQPGNSYGLVSQYRTQQGYQTRAPPANLAYQYATSTASPPSIKAGSPGISTWSPGYPSMNRSPGLAPASTSGRSMSGLPSPNAAQPPLIRTSTLQQTPSPATTPASGQTGQAYNPYALYPHKAVLKIQGDLDSMAENWSAEEWDSKRRLVHFQRTQQGSTITTTFKPVAIDSRPQHSTCVSCIWWEQKNECFVTSVDTIALLESLVAARFTVEEKNRIRRNLEGFHPLTVSKAKADSEEFFKVIMAFPNPKPRNIEKDVKVFPWKILSHALKKIIGKYSASPSSTLPPTLLTPVSSTGYATESSSISTGLSHSTSDYNAVSPRSVSGSTTSTAYCASNSVTSKGGSHALSPHTQQAITAHAQGGSGSGASDLRIAAPSYGSMGAGPGPNTAQLGNASLDASNTWQGSHHMGSGPSTQYQQLANPNGRASWDLGYLHNLEPSTVGAGAVPQSGSGGGGGLHNPASGAGGAHGLSLNSRTLNTYANNNHSRSPSSGAITENRASSLSGQQNSSSNASHQPT